MFWSAWPKIFAYIWKWNSLKCTKNSTFILTHGKVGDNFHLPKVNFNGHRLSLISSHLWWFNALLTVRDFNALYTIHISCIAIYKIISITWSTYHEQFYHTADVKWYQNWHNADNSVLHCPDLMIKQGKTHLGSWS